MRRITILITALLLALGMTAGPAMAHHEHVLVTPGKDVPLPCEPEHVGGWAGDEIDPPLVHPRHERQHKGPGAPSDETHATERSRGLGEPVAGGDPVNIIAPHGADSCDAAD